MKSNQIEAENEMGFWEHLLALRKTLLQCFLVTVLMMGLCFFYYQEIFTLITRPLYQTEKSLQHKELKKERIQNLGTQEMLFKLPDPSSVPTNASTGVKYEEKELTYHIPPGGYLDVESAYHKEKLVIFGPIEGMMITFKVCFWLGLVLSFPFILFFLLRFAAPGLKREEMRLAIPCLCLSIFFISAGFALAYFVTIPIANQYLQAFNASIGENLWSLSEYLDYTFFLLLANGVAFEIGLILLILVHLGFLTHETMVAKRRHMVVVAFIVGAILTPPDVMTQLMLAIPLILLYELAIFYAALRKKRILLNPNMN